jgi:hypothetical protein
LASGRRWHDFIEPYQYPSPTFVFFFTMCASARTSLLMPQRIVYTPKVKAEPSDRKDVR